MLFSVILLLLTIQTTYQKVYSCDPKVVCGCSTYPASITRIVGGEDAGIATWGWAVSIYINSNFICGGSIISSSWIITAAHCVYEYTASQIDIYSGSIVRGPGTQNRVASQIIIHPNYISATYENDIALLRLTSPLTMSDPNISPICIPSVDSTILSTGEWPAAGTTVVAIGWGTFYENGPIATVLQQVTVSTVDYRSSTCHSQVVDNYIQLCAGVSGGGKDTCQGDSGGPLMMFTSTKQWVLVGVTSFGHGCAQPAFSGIYTRVAVYEDWIRLNTNGFYSSLSLSHANTMQKSMHYLVFFVLLALLVKFH